jgi:hypothetical protein
LNYCPNEQEHYRGKCRHATHLAATVSFTRSCKEKYRSKQDEGNGWDYDAGDYSYPSRRPAESVIKQDAKQLRKGEDAYQRQESPRNYK